MPSQPSIQELRNIQSQLEGKNTFQNLHGDFFTTTVRGMTFSAPGGTVGIAVPVFTTTAGTTWGLLNPVTSTVNLVPLRLRLNFLTSTPGPATANVMGISVQSLVANPIVSGLTTVGGTALNFSGAASQGLNITAGTFTNPFTAVQQFPIFSFPASYVPAAGSNPQPLTVDFMGSVIIPPGVCAILTAYATYLTAMVTAAQTANYTPGTATNGVVPNTIYSWIRNASALNGTILAPGT